MNRWISLAGKYGLAGLMIIVGFFFYEKNSNISALIIGIGIILSAALIISDITHKHKELDGRLRGFLD